MRLRKEAIVQRESWGRQLASQDCFKAGAASRPFWTVELVGVKEDC